MSHSDKWRKMDEEKIVKCACGLPMRQKNWADHWRSCYVASSVPVTEEDEKCLLVNEARRKREADEHQAWLASGGASRGRLCIRNGTLAVE